MDGVDGGRGREKGGDTGEKKSGIDPAPLSLGTVQRDLPPGKTNHIGKVMDVALQDPPALPSGRPTL